MSRRKTLASGIAALAIVLGSAVVTAAPAEAAAGGYCSKQVINYSPAVWTVPADANFNTLCRLDQGANSIAVKALQAGLNGRCAVSAGLAVDGQFGAATRNALVAAQRKFGVTADGIYGPNTARVFRWTASDNTCRTI